MAKYGYVAMSLFGTFVRIPRLVDAYSCPGPMYLGVADVQPSSDHFLNICFPVRCFSNGLQHIIKIHAENDIEKSKARARPGQTTTRRAVAKEGVKKEVSLRHGVRRCGKVRRFGN